MKGFLEFNLQLYQPIDSGVTLPQPTLFFLIIMLMMLRVMVMVVVGMKIFMRMIQMTAMVMFVGSHFLIFNRFE